MTPTRQGLTLLGAAGLLLLAVGCASFVKATFPTYYEVTVNPGDEKSAAWVCVTTEHAQLFCADLESQLKKAGTAGCPLPALRPVGDGGYGRIWEPAL